MPSRAHTFGRVLASILPQLDRLFLFFDKYEHIPHAFANDPRIVPLSASDFGELAVCGKFLGVQLHAEPCLYFCFDDDILYPPDYVEFMTRALHRHHLQALIGLHALVIKPPYLSYPRDCSVLHFSHPCRTDFLVDVLGTGTIAFYTGNFRFNPKSWRFNDMADLMVAIEAAKQSLPRVSVQRTKNYLVPLEQYQIDSLFHRLLKDNSRHSEIMRKGLNSCRLSSRQPIESFAVHDQQLQNLIIDTTHGVVPNANPDLFLHLNLLDRHRFIAHLQGREQPYVPLSTCLRGEGDALTIDDSTLAAAEAARLARYYGHAVTLFVNGYNIAEQKCYSFSRLDAALDAAKVESVVYEGREYALRMSTSAERFRAIAKRKLTQLRSEPDQQAIVGEIGRLKYDLRMTMPAHRFRARIKQKLIQLGSERDRQRLVTNMGRLLGIDKIIVPPFQRPITRAALMELAAEGVDVQNHGWTHAHVGALPLDEHVADIQRGREWLQATCGAEADLFAAPYGDGLPFWDVSEDYRAWFLLDSNRPLGRLGAGLFNRRTLAL